MDLDIIRIERAVNDTVGILRDGLLATDVWDVETGLSYAGHNAQPAAVALFNRLTSEINETLAQASFPELNRYYMLDCEGALVVILQGPKRLHAGVLLDSTKVNLGILVGAVVPNYLRALHEAEGIPLSG